MKLKRVFKSCHDRERERDIPLRHHSLFLMGLLLLGGGGVRRTLFHFLKPFLKNTEKKKSKHAKVYMISSVAN